MQFFRLVTARRKISQISYVIFQTTSQFFFKGCVCYIFASLFLGLNESTCQMKKIIFYFTSKPLFVPEKNQILEFYIFKFHDVIKPLSIKQEIHFTE